MISSMLHLGLGQITCRKLLMLFSADLVSLTIVRVSVRGSEAAEWDKNTWPPFEDLARNHPEAGVHFQDCEIHNRSKDVGSATAAWFSELLSPSPWFKDVVPKVRSKSDDCEDKLADHEYLVREFAER